MRLDIVGMQADSKKRLEEMVGRDDEKARRTTIILDQKENEMGEDLRISLETTLGLQTAKQENWDKVFNRLRVQGFGDFYQKDKYILIKTPFINDAEIWNGLLEGLLDVKLDLKTSVAPLVFE